MSIRDNLPEDRDEEPEEREAGEAKEKPELPNFLKALWSDSPDKDLDEYINHTLNWDKKESTGRIIRGTEGIIGELNKSIVDIGIGVIQKVIEAMKKKEPEEVVV